MDQCYCSVLLGKTKDNTYSRSEGGPTQKTKRREAPILLSFLLLCIYLLPWSLSYVNWASQEGCLFYLRSSLWSLDIPLFYFPGLFPSFPSLSFSHHHFGLLFPIITTYHPHFKRWKAQFFGKRGIGVSLATSC